MKIAVVGKGGSGKTTTSAVIARTTARRGVPTLALDCDTNPNLGLSLGLGESATEALIAVRQAVDDGDADHALTLGDVVQRFGADAPDGVRLAVVSAIQNPKPGCPCCGVSPEQLLGQLDGDGRVTVADFEAGLGTLIRMGERPVDVVVVVVEPTAKSLEIGSRAVRLVREHRLGRVVVAANRIGSDDDLARVRAAFPGLDPIVVPEEPAIIAAERNGEAPLDAAPEAPGVRALVTLAESLVPAGR